MGIEGLYTPKRIRTYCGQYINVITVTPEQIYPMDIAVGLSRECRFGNYTKRPYSVAEHSILCMQTGQLLFPGDNQLHLALLLHDAHEAYIRDWPTPIVEAIAEVHDVFPSWVQNFKMTLQNAINKRFGVTIDIFKDQRIKDIDRQALEWEWQNKVIAWTGLEMDARTSESLWLHYFKELCKVPHVLYP